MLLSLAVLGSPISRGGGAVTVNLIDSEMLLTDSLLSIKDSSAVSVACSTTNLKDGLALLRRFRPEVVLVSGEIFLEGMSAFSDELGIRVGESALGIFADTLTDVQLTYAIEPPVSGLFSKQVTREELFEGIEKISQGLFHVASTLKNRVVWDPVKRRPVVGARERLSRLTGRQLEVLVQLAGGDSVREIATRMHLSEKAVESHKFRIMNRLGINNRVQLCRWAIREGLIGA